MVRFCIHTESIMNPVLNSRKTFVPRSEMRGTSGQLQQFHEDSRAAAPYTTVTPDATRCRRP